MVIEEAPGDVSAARRCTGDDGSLRALSFLIRCLKHGEPEHWKCTVHLENCLV